VFFLNIFFKQRFVKNSPKVTLCSSYHQLVDDCTKEEKITCYRRRTRWNKTYSDLVNIKLPQRYIDLSTVSFSYFSAPCSLQGGRRMMGRVCVKGLFRSLCGLSVAFYSSLYPSGYGRWSLSFIYTTSSSVRPAHLSGVGWSMMPLENGHHLWLLGRYGHCCAAFKRSEQFHTAMSNLIEIILAFCNHIIQSTCE